MAGDWVLELTDIERAPRERVGGLTTALRLALDAQWAKASGVVVGAGGASTAQLADARLRIPVLERAPDGAQVVRVPAHYVVHRSAFEAALASSEPIIELIGAPIELRAPFAFEPIAVTDAAARRRAERALFRSLRKAQDGWTSRWLNRYLSLAVSRWLVKTPLRPNQVSLGILGIGLLGAWFAAHGDYRSLVIGALLFQAQSVLDGCDGEMSRVTYRGSLLGEWLDTVGDDLTNYSFFTAAGFGLYWAGGHVAYLVASIVTVLAGVIACTFEYRYLISIGSGDLLKYPISAPQPPGTKPGPLAVLTPLFKRDTFVFITLLAAIAGYLGPMLIVFAAGAVGILLNVLAAERRMARERRAARSLV